MRKNSAAHSRAFEVEAKSFAAYPLALLAAAFSLGILGALFFAVLPWPVISLAAIFSLLAVVAFLISRKQGLATILLILASASLGASLSVIEKVTVPANQIKRLIDQGVIAVGDPIELTGVLEREPEMAPERLYFQLRVQAIRTRKINSGALASLTETEERQVSGVVMLIAPVPNQSAKREFEQLNLRYGARLRVLTRLQRADNFRNPGVSSYTEFLDRKGYDASGFVKSPSLIERLDNDRVFLPLAWLFQWRRKLQTEIDAHFSAETAGVLDASMLGNRYKLSRAASERFREGGTFHALVISGLHITFLGGVVFLIARRFTKSRILQFLFSNAVLWAYAVAVGAEPSVVRAALMFTMIILAPLVWRRAASLNVLGGTGLALLAARPSNLFDPSFQLTFASVLAMVVLAWPLLEKMSAIGSWRLTRQTPYPPSCAPALRVFCELLYWSEREAQRELERANYNYRVFKTPLAEILERYHLQRLLRYSFAAIVVSASVQLALLPFLIVYFHRLSLASLVLNIGVSLMMAGVAFFAAVALIVVQFSATLAAPLISITNGLNWLMVHSVDPFAKVGLASIRIPEYSGWASVVYGAYYLPVVWLVVLLLRWNPLLRKDVAAAKSRRILNARVVTAALVFTTTFVVLHPFSASQMKGKLRIDFLDVGQGDAALVTLPDNTTMLVDGGGRPGPFQRDQNSDEAFERETRSIGETVVSEYLWWRGLDRVDYLLATHADADHIDGLNDVARNFAVRAVFVARTPRTDAEYARLVETLRTQNTRVQLIGAGDVLRFGDVSATVLWPLPLSDANAPSRNNDSAVLRFQIGERSMLLTGDIEAAAEAALINSTETLHCDVVKVPHHGSKSSSTVEFVAATKPSFAIASVGQTSPFGHPHPSVVERWRAGGAQVLTTGNCGTITVSSDGRDLQVEKFVK